MYKNIKIYKKKIILNLNVAFNYSNIYYGNYMYIYINI